MTNEEVIVYQAQKICQLEKEAREANEGMNFWLSKYFEVSAKYEPLKAETEE